MSSERFDDAAAAIVRRTSADPEGDRSSARVDRGEEELAGPDRRRAEWITLGGCQPGEPGRHGHLDHGLGPGRARPHQPRTVDLTSDRVGHPGVTAIPAACRLDRVERAFAAVGQRREGQVVGRPSAAPTVRERPGDLH